jgi:hypothetical protein
MIDFYAEVVKLNLNLSMEVIIGFLSVIPMVTAVLMTLFHSIKDKYRHGIYLAMGWSSMTMWCVFQSFSVLFLSKDLFKIGLNCLTGAGFCVILLMDSINRESVDPMKIMIMTAISSGVIIFSFEPNSVRYYMTQYKDVGMFMDGNYLIFIFLIILFDGALYSYYMTKVYRHVPKKLKFFAGINLFGGIMVGIITPISVILFEDVLPGANQPLAGIGALMISIAFVYQPKLAYVLPFKASRLTIIETRSGIPIYTYNWSKMVLMDETLFSGMLYAVSQFVEESIQKGNIREISLDQAILLLQRSEEYPIVCVLITNRSSRSLRMALNRFSNNFFKNFSQFFTQPIDQSKFETALDLVLDAFPFLPAYD